MGAGDTAAVCGAVGQVDPGLPVLRRQREHRPVGAAARELRGEHLAEGSRTCPGIPAPHSGVERRDVDDVEVERVEPDVGDAERTRVVPVPDFGERSTAIGRLVEARGIRARLEPRLATVADHVRESTDSLRRPDEDVIRVARVDDDGVDSAAKEGVVVRHHARIGGVADALVVELRPGFAAVRRLVDADAGLAAGGAAVALTRP